MYKFEFFFGSRLNIGMYTIFDGQVKILQWDGANISFPLKMVRDLVKEFKNHRDGHDSFWNDTRAEN